MQRCFLAVYSASIALFLAGCGGSGGGGGGGITPPPSNAPVLSSIAPSNATVGSTSITLVIYGSNLASGATILWNGSYLVTQQVNAGELSAVIPDSDLASVGSAEITVANPSPDGGTSGSIKFTISSAAAATTWVRKTSKIDAPQDVVWDPKHERLYVSIDSTDSYAPNTIAAVDPVAGEIKKQVAAGEAPNLISVSSGNSYLWVGLDGESKVQRFVLPEMTKDIFIPIPSDSVYGSQQAVTLEAAPVDPHTVALLAGRWGWSPTGDGIYIYDDDKMRPNFVSDSQIFGGPIDWMQWGGGDDAVIYGNQYTSIDFVPGIARIDVNSQGATFIDYAGGQSVDPIITQYDRTNGLLYSYGAAYDPVIPALAGTFDLPETGSEACTADSSVNRYYCVTAYPYGGSDLVVTELWVFDLTTYSFLDRTTLGQPNAPLLSGRIGSLVRWGKAGLAVTTYGGDSLYGNGGLFLIDGASVNPGAPPDAGSGSSAFTYAWMNSLTPQVALAGSGDSTVTIQGSSFVPDSTACWNCGNQHWGYLPTTYVSPTELKATIPASVLSNPASLTVSTFDPGSNTFSTDSLTFSVSSGSSGSQIMPVQIQGLAMVWDAKSGLIYVGTSNLATTHPNSIVAIDPSDGSIANTLAVGNYPYLLDVSADGEYLYVGYGGENSMAQLHLPDLGSPITWTLNDPENPGPFHAIDLKAAPSDPHTTAVALVPSEGQNVGNPVAIYDDARQRPVIASGEQQLYTRLAWGNSDSALAGSESYDGVGPLYVLQASASGVSFVKNGAQDFNGIGDQLHSDFGTGLIYDDDGQVASPVTGALVGHYNASGLAAPDSSLDRVFILGQTAAQAGTSNFTIDSFDEKAFSAVGSITLNALAGNPLQLIRWGTSGLAVLTDAGELYLIQDGTFVSTNGSSGSGPGEPAELVQRRWRFPSRMDRLKAASKASD